MNPDCEDNTCQEFKLLSYCKLVQLSLSGGMNVQRQCIPNAGLLRRT